MASQTSQMTQMTQMTQVSVQYSQLKEVLRNTSYSNRQIQKHFEQMMDAYENYDDQARLFDQHRYDQLL